nr:MAG TPA: hypothetical protein [Caudoviricetes sp.]
MITYWSKNPFNTTCFNLGTALRKNYLLNCPFLLNIVHNLSEAYLNV